MTHEPSDGSPLANEDVRRLIAERALAREDFDDDQIAGLWASAVTSYRDASVSGLSTDGALQHAYAAALQATLAVLAALGLRVRGSAGHFKTFYALEKLALPALSEHAILFN